MYGSSRIVKLVDAEISSFYVFTLPLMGNETLMFNLCRTRLLPTFMKIVCWNTFWSPYNSKLSKLSFISIYYWMLYFIYSTTKSMNKQINHYSCNNNSSAISPIGRYFSNLILTPHDHVRMLAIRSALKTHWWGTRALEKWTRFLSRNLICPFP